MAGTQSAEGYTPPVALVTGAAGGIGRAIARRFIREGATVIGAHRSVDAQRNRMVHSEDGTAHLQYSVDVRDEASVAELFADIDRDHRRLNILVNNAGIGGASNLAELDARHYDEVMDTNVRGMLLCTKYAIKLIEAAGGGSVINIASLGSFIGLPGSASYCASKGAVVAFTREAALELAPSRIRVNAVAPGYIDNDMFHRYIGAQSDPAVALAQTVADIPLGRLGTNDDVAAAVAFLASQDAQWITGATLTVDGGTLCR